MDENWGCLLFYPSTVVKCNNLGCQFLWHVAKGIAMYISKFFILQFFTIQIFYIYIHIYIYRPSDPIASHLSSLLVNENPGEHTNSNISRRIPSVTVWSPHPHIFKFLVEWYVNFLHDFAVQHNFQVVLKILWVLLITQAVFVCEAHLYILMLLVSPLVRFTCSKIDLNNSLKRNKGSSYLWQLA